MANFEELMLKVGKDILSPVELEEWRQKAREIETQQGVLRGWLRGTDTPYFKNFTAEQGFFVNIPLGAAEAACTNSYSLTILHDTQTFVPFDTRTPIYNDLYFSVDKDLSRVVVKKVPLRIAVLGYYGMGNSATGYMRIKISRFDKDGNQQSVQIINRAKLASTSSETMSSFFRVYNTKSFGVSEGDYYEFEVYQNSTATLTSVTFQALFLAVS